jgi:hypothetical protein
MAVAADSLSRVEGTVWTRAWGKLGVQKLPPNVSIAIISVVLVTRVGDS